MLPFFLFMIIFNALWIDLIALGGNRVYFKLDLSLSASIVLTLIA
jgi:hypothetical protein